ncbi:hypothetical protein [Microcoleus sp. SVA1_A1]|uniref:hypothetical protein n=1 Tax=Microcoleus sp. SVA1_A1 TaxID=2818946 RepID=UPI002FD0B8A2
MAVSPEERVPQRQPRYSKEEFTQRRTKLYESQLRSQVEEGNHGKMVAIDHDTESIKCDRRFRRMRCCP